MKYKLLLVLTLLGTSLFASANDCPLTIEGNDRLQFNEKTLTVSSTDCKTVTLTLKHVGKIPAQSMGHNWVLTKTDDYNSVARAGMGAGLQNNYVPKDDVRVIASTKVVGGGEETSVTFPISAVKAGKDYTFFCSFPGHFGIMKGKFIVK